MSSAVGTFSVSPTAETESFVPDFIDELPPPAELVTQLSQYLNKSGSGGYLGPQQWEAAVKETVGNRAQTLMRKVKYEIWKDWACRVDGETRLLLPEKAPEMKVYDTPKDTKGRTRRTPNRFAAPWIISRLLLHRERLKAIDSALQQLPQEYHDTAVLLAHGVIRYRLGVRLRDGFTAIAHYKKWTFSVPFRGKTYRGTLNPVYWARGARLLAKELAMSALDITRFRVGDYEVTSGPKNDMPTAESFKKLQDGQQPYWFMFLCHDSRLASRTTIDQHDFGRILVSRNTGGVIEDASDPLCLNSVALNALSHAMKSGCSEIIIGTHGRCGCANNATCTHGKSLFSDAPIGDQVMHRLGKTLGYAVNPVKEKAAHPFADKGTLRDYALGLFNMSKTDMKCIESFNDLDNLAVEALTGIHRLELVKNFIAKYTASELNAGLKGKDETATLAYMDHLYKAGKITEKAWSRLSERLQDGCGIVIGKDDVIPAVKVRLIHQELRTLDTFLWNDDAKRFVSVMRDRPLSQPARAPTASANPPAMRPAA